MMDGNSPDIGPTTPPAEATQTPITVAPRSAGAVEGQPLATPVVQNGTGEKPRLFDRVKGLFGASEQPQPPEQISTNFAPNQEQSQTPAGVEPAQTPSITEPEPIPTSTSLEGLAAQPEPPQPVRTPDNTPDLTQWITDRFDLGPQEPEKLKTTVANALARDKIETYLRQLAADQLVTLADITSKFSDVLTEKTTSSPELDAKIKQFIEDYRRLNSEPNAAQSEEPEPSPTVEASTLPPQPESAGPANDPIIPSSEATQTEIPPPPNTFGTTVNNQGPS